MKIFKQFILRMALSLLKWAETAAIDNEASRKVINDLFITVNAGILYQQLAIYLVKKRKLKFYYLLTGFINVEYKEIRFRLDRHLNPEQNPELPVIEIPWVKKSKFTDQVKDTSVYEQNKKVVRRGELAAKKMKRENDRTERLKRKESKLRDRIINTFFSKSKGKPSKAK